MKSISTLSRNFLLTGIIALFFAIEGTAQVMGTYEFSTGVTCATLDMDVTAQPTNAVFTPFYVGGTPVCEDSGLEYTTTNWSTGSVADINNYFLFFTISANSGYSLDLTQITFDITRSANGPTAGQIYTNVDGAPFTSEDVPFVPTTTKTNYTVPLALTTISGGCVTFKLAFWNATTSDASSKICVDNIQLTGNTPLPVELVKFEVQPANHTVNVNWATATEVNNDFFTIERSANGRDYVELGTLTGAGFSSVWHDYSFNDESPLAGKSFYRIKQTDYNGKYTFSNVIALETQDTSDFELNVFPNPSNGTDLNVNIRSSEDEIVTVKLMDMTGKKLHSETMNVFGSSSLTSDINPAESLSSGIYFLTASTATSSYTKRLIIR